MVQRDGRRQPKQKITAEAVALYQSAQAAVASWQASRHAGERLGRAAENDRPRLPVWVKAA